MTSLRRDQIPEPVVEIVRRLNDAGHRAWVVGGCIRDLLRGKEVSDWDIATSALPGEVKKVFKKVIPTGIQHGKIYGTDVRCYEGRDYIQRLAALKGETPQEVDPTGTSQSYYVLESAGRAGDTIRVVSALVRESRK